MALNSAGIDFDGKGFILSITMMILVPDCEYKRAPGKDDFNLFWTRSIHIVRFCFSKMLGLDHFGLAHLSILLWGFFFFAPQCFAIVAT